MLLRLKCCVSRCKTTNTEGEDELCCILQPPNFISNLFVVQCDIIDVNTITPVTKTRHETLLSNIIKIASPDSGEMGNEVLSKNTVEENIQRAELTEFLYRSSPSFHRILGPV